MKPALPILATLAVAIPTQAPAQTDDLPFKNDETGINWVLPFKKALRQAKEENRLLVIKPIAFGTDKNGGW